MIILSINILFIISYYIIGNQLQIKEPDMEHEIFSDLDEIYARYIEPMNDLVSAMITHRSFRMGSIAEVEQSLYGEIDQNPLRNPYCIRFNPGVPGTFILTWIIKSSSKPVKTEKIYVRPQGYKLKNELFARPSDLIQWFKNAANSAAEKQQQQLQQQKAVVPPSQTGLAPSQVQKAFQNISQTISARQQQAGTSGMGPSHMQQQPERKSRLFAGSSGMAAATGSSTNIGGGGIPVGGGYGNMVGVPPPMYGGPPMASMTPNIYNQPYTMGGGGGMTPAGGYIPPLGGQTPGGHMYPPQQGVPGAYGVPPSQQQQQGRPMNTYPPRR